MKFIRATPPHTWGSYAHLGAQPNDHDIKRALFIHGGYGREENTTNPNYNKPLYKCSTEQAAAAATYLKALKAVRKWLVDTGCGSDLISRDVAEKFTEPITGAKHVIFKTASDSSGSSDQLHLVCEELGGDKVEAYLMESTPPVMSVGKRI